MKVIAIQNQKGGACKTTTCVNLALQLIKPPLNKKVLIIDLDQQGNTTKSISGRDKTDEIFKKKNIAKIFFEDEEDDKINLENLVIRFDNIDLIASSRRLVKANTYIVNDTDKDIKLYNKIQELKTKNLYDYCIIDTNPAVDNIFLNAQYGCDEILIPMKAEQYHIDGLADMIDIIANTNKVCSQNNIPNKKINGILFCDISKATKLHQDNMRECREILDKMGIYCYNNYIRHNIKIAESQGENLSVEEFNKNANGTKDYKAVLNEFLEKENK